jgi:hypothetical protein
MDVIVPAFSLSSKNLGILVPIRIDVQVVISIQLFGCTEYPIDLYFVPVPYDHHLPFIRSHQIY